MILQPKHQKAVRQLSKACFLSNELLVNKVLQNNKPVTDWINHLVECIILFLLKVDKFDWSYYHMQYVHAHVCTRVYPKKFALSWFPYSYSS